MFRDLSIPGNQDEKEIKFLGLLVNENEFHNNNLEDDEEEIFRDHSSSEEDNEIPGKARR